jgi:hypothetical protein
MPRALPLLILAVALVPAQTSAGSTPAACTPGSLVAAFVIVNGSAGAGQITYKVRLRNMDSASCTVSGRPGIQLLDHHRHPLPTHVFADHPGTGTAALITLRHGEAANANARFSPDIPGPREPTHGACQPKAHFVRVTLSSPSEGTLTGSVLPPTSVCSHGRIALGLLQHE